MSIVRRDYVVCGNSRYVLFVQACAKCFLFANELVLQLSDVSYETFIAEQQKICKKSNNLYKRCVNFSISNVSRETLEISDKFHMKH